MPNKRRIGTKVKDALKGQKEERHKRAHRREPSYMTTKPGEGLQFTAEKNMEMWDKIKKMEKLEKKRGYFTNASGFSVRNKK
jgi:hypothetical protein